MLPEETYISSASSSALARVLYEHVNLVSLEILCLSATSVRYLFFRLSY